MMTLYESINSVYYRCNISQDWYSFPPYSPHTFVFMQLVDLHLKYFTIKYFTFLTMPFYIFNNIIFQK